MYFNLLTLLRRSFKAQFQHHQGRICLDFRAYYPVNLELIETIVQYIGRCKVLILAPLRKGCGNNTTAARIKYHMDRHGIECIMCGVDQFTSTENFTTYITNQGVTVMIALHALHAGKWLCDLEPEFIPNVVIFGGTDLNEYSNNGLHLKTMTKVIDKASYLVCFSEQMKSKMLSIWPHIADAKVRQIAQGNRLYVAPKPKPSRVSISEGLQEKYGLDEDSVIFTLVAGIRPVKDPIFLLRRFSEWHKSTNSKCYLLIAGPVLDESYAETFQEVVKQCSGVIYLGVLPAKDAHSLMKESFAIVNSSHSEGMCVALLEAMELGVPVIARDIPGNQSIIKNTHNGFLYSTPEEFIQCATTLLSDDTLYCNISDNARTYIDTYHNGATECQAYISLVQDLTSTGKCFPVISTGDNCEVNGYCDLPVNHVNTRNM